MISVMENKKCCGCTACMDICPTKAITISPDREGFLYPTIDNSKCTDCGLCEKVCPAIELPEFNAEPDVYAVQLKDKETLRLSQSGGAFWALANVILQNNGVVYGAAFNENLRVVHSRAENIDEARKFHGSKYVQSDMSGIMKQIKADLLLGKEVLFSGTACQVSGLYKFLGKNYNNLTTCDLICHGVPSPLLLEKFFEYIEKKNKVNIQDFYFGYYRPDEGYTWNDPREERIFLFDGSSIRSNKYIQMFTSNWCLRPYCHSCPFTKTERVADFTIGDFWGVKKYTNMFNTDKGVSVLFANSEKAKQNALEILDLTIYEHINVENVKNHQHNLKKPSLANKRRGLLIKKLINKGFISAYRADRFYYFLYCLKQKVLGR